MSALPSFRASDLKVCGRLFLFGILISESFLVGGYLGKNICEYFDGIKLPVVFLFCLSCLALFLIYFYIRGGSKTILMFISGGYWHHLFFLVLGAAFSINANGFFSEFYKPLAVPSQILLFLGGVLILLWGIIFVFLIRRFSNPHKVNQVVPYFLSDAEVESFDNDFLDVKGMVGHFAEKVCNGGSSDSLVFGIDAPWGAGKSSFVNMCVKYWENLDSKTIIYKFQVLRYMDEKELVSQLADGLASAIQQQVYAPSLKSVFSEYSNLISGERTTFLGFNLLSFFEASSVDDLFDELQNILTRVDCRIIVVIDDLDRISIDTTKNIVRAIRQSFMLPKISYVFCYDSERLTKNSSIAGDNEDINNFFEKYINIKISLFLDAHRIISYLKEGEVLLVERNLSKEPKSLAKAKETIEEVVNICASKDFHLYSPFIGDIRKIKRLLNAVMLFDLNDVDFQNLDFDKRDLVHLILIYINYPSVFRKMYASETGEGKSGFFSQEKNYKEYIKDFSDKNLSFLMDKIFNEKGQESDEFYRRRRARFNGEHPNNNLEKYLNLIVNFSQPERSESYSFLVVQANKIISGSDIDQVLNMREFNDKEGMARRGELWRVITNSSLNMSKSCVDRIVDYIVNHAGNYSLVDWNGYFGDGSREKLIYNLLSILNSAGWKSDNELMDRKSAENSHLIADRVFGEGEYHQRGILDRLTNEARGFLGFRDAVSFRLECSMERSGHLGYLQSALFKRANPNQSMTGGGRSIEIEVMRGISQVVFKKFYEEYVKKSINIFSIIDELTISDFFGLYNDESGDEDLIKIEKEKNRIKAFSVYQLGSTQYDNMISCGYYDMEGKEDKHEISSIMQSYLINVCFNPKISRDNYRHFIDYLLLSVNRSNARISVTRNAFLKVLTGDQLSKYWADNKEEILKEDFEKSDRNMFTYDYSISYGDSVRYVYEILDGDS